MSSWSRNEGRRDERPTLPPIRDLLQGLLNSSAGVENYLLTNEKTLEGLTTLLR
jgi:hypothetical protein